MRTWAPLLCASFKKTENMTIVFPSALGFFFLIFKFYIGAQLMNNVSVPGVQQSDSVTHIHVSILFQILFPFRSFYITEQSSLCYTVGPC